jgi:predicted DNA-binding WGR domain protein
MRPVPRQLRSPLRDRAFGAQLGRIGTNGQELAEVFDNDIEAGETLEAIARAKRRRGYRDL